MPIAAEILVDVRVVDDLAGQKHTLVRKTLARLVGVVDGAIDAVAEAELAREMDGQPSGAIREIVGLDVIDDRAVIVLGEHAGDGMLQIEAFTEDERRQLPLRACLAHMGRELVEGQQLARARTLERRLQVR